MSDDGFIHDARDLIGMLNAAYANSVLMELRDAQPVEQGLFPLTAHPHYERYADSIRKSMDRGIQRVQLPNMTSRIRGMFLEADTPEPEPLHTTTLTARRRWAPAPWTGEEYVYVWPVAVDDYGRGISGEAVRTLTGRIGL